MNIRICDFDLCEQQAVEQDVLRSRAWCAEHRLSHHRWPRPDGTLDVSAMCLSLDAAANAATGAGAPRA